MRAAGRVLWEADAQAADDARLAEAVTLAWRTTLRRAPEAAGGTLIEWRVGLQRVKRFCAEIKALTGFSLPAWAVYVAPNLPAMIRLVKTRRLPDLPAAVVLRAGAGLEPVFVLAGAAGWALELCDIGRAIERSWPVVALMPPGLGNADEAVDTVEEMALYHYDAMKSVQPSGPYHILGYSWGGLVAIEIARLLRERGEVVGSVACLEAPLPESAWPAVERWKFVARRIGDHARQLRAATRPERAAYLWARVRPMLNRFRRLSGTSGAVKSPYAIDGLPPELERVHHCALRAFYAYRPSRYEGPVSLIVTEDGDPFCCDAAAAWRAYLPGMELHTVPGGHSGMIHAPAAQAIGAIVPRNLQVASAGRAG